jgi:hypothetical protein|tara:strand:+ start:89 stop:586 length:498 start_codon:yes stop_codon:yes gene_type:complete
VNNFFVVGLPRSRTAWFANFLTYENNFCYHEGINGCSNITEYKNKLGKNKGDSCTSLMLLNLNKEFPNAPVLIIETEIERAVKFSKEIYGNDLTNELKVLKEQMKFLKGLRIPLDDINDSLEEIWSYLIGTPYDKNRGDLLKNMNIQTNNYFNYDFKSAGELLCL